MTSKSPVQRLAKYAEEGDFDAFESLLIQTDNPWEHPVRSDLFEGETTLLHLISALGELDFAELALNHGAQVNATDSNGWLPIQQAFLHGQEEMALWLLEEGAEIDFHTACLMGHEQMVKDLLKSGPSLAKKEGPEGTHPIHFASTSRIVEILANAGADLQAKDSRYGATPLQWLVEYPDSANKLLELGAEIPDLLTACAIGKTDFAINGLRENPKLIAMMSEGKSLFGPNVSLLHAGVMSGSLELVSQLIEHGADVMKKGGHEGATPLHWAAKYGWPEIAKLLLKNGANPLAEDQQSQATPFAWAFEFGQDETIEVLKDFTPKEV